MLNIDHFVRLRPYLYHLTAEENLSFIRELRTLQCAGSLLHSAGLPHLASMRRRQHLEVVIDDGTRVIRDQKPLAVGAIVFEDGWNLERFIEHVNERVFFWPGTSEGPIRPGLNHFERYRSERPKIIRISTTDLPAANAEFSRYNSGAPRCSGGKYSPRGSSTYLPADRFAGTASDVVEVVAVLSCSLPIDAEISDSPRGPWHGLFSAA